MSKIFKLFIDENIKTWKKLSTKILIIVTVIALIGALGLVMFVKYMNENTEVANSVYNWKEDIKAETEMIKKALVSGELDEENTRIMKAQLEKNELAIKYDINPYGSYWKSEILEQVKELKQEEGKETEISKLVELLDKDNFAGYVEKQKESQKQLLDKKEITQEEYDDKITILDLKAKYEIGKNEDDEYWKKFVLNETENLQRSIRTGIDYNSRKALTVEKKQEYEDTVKMNIYRIENNMPPVEYADENYRIVFETLAPGFVIAMIALFAIIMAGGAISTEVSTGTIKFWALTPNKRWKILSAKILSILFYIVVLTLVMSLLTIACANMFFDDRGTEYIYIKNGNVETIGNTLYMIEYYFAKIIPVIIFALFALMLSTVTRNTSVAVSFSVATYIGNGIVMAIINQYIKKDWVRFIPFNNLNIVDKIFPNVENPMALLGETFATSTSLQFSLGVLAVCAVLMLVTMYDSFNHRDII